jgi:hypothetical protein
MMSTSWIELNLRVMVLLEQTVLVVINGVWNLVIKRFSFNFITPNYIYSSIEAYVGKFW